MTEKKEKKQEHRPQHETRLLLIALFHQANRSLSRTEVARAIRRSKSPGLIAALDELVQEGIIERGIKTYHNKVRGYEYWLKQDPQ